MFCMLPVFMFSPKASGSFLSFCFVSFCFCFCLLVLFLPLLSFILLHFMGEVIDLQEVYKVEKGTVERLRGSLSIDFPRELPQAPYVNSLPLWHLFMNGSHSTVNLIMISWNWDLNIIITETQRSYPQKFRHVRKRSWSEIEVVWGKRK